jgi:hypothetical protein
MGGEPYSMDHSSTSNAIAVLDAAPSASSAVVKNDNAQHTRTDDPKIIV